VPVIFRQLFDSKSSTYSYLLGDARSGLAALIDPVRQQVDRDLQLVEELDLTLELVLETHLHVDHVTGAAELRERTGAKVVASERGAPTADLHVREGDVVRVGAIDVRVLETPGHSEDSLSFLAGNKLFTGDALLIRGTGRTDLQNGDPGQLYDSLTQILFHLPEETEVWPAHDDAGRCMSTIGEEKRHNPRLAGRSRVWFVDFMNKCRLEPPRLIDVALPANRACGNVTTEVSP
jgi:sulfur dioxygenase